jgi:hypothetical protein
MYAKQEHELMGCENKLVVMAIEKYTTKFLFTQPNCREQTHQCT